MLSPSSSSRCARPSRSSPGRGRAPGTMAQPGRAGWKSPPDCFLVITARVLQGKGLRSRVIDGALLLSPAGGKVGWRLCLPKMRNCCNLQRGGHSSIPEQDEATAKPSMTHLNPVDLSPDRAIFSPLSQRNPIVCLRFFKHTFIFLFDFSLFYTQDAAKELCTGMGKGGNSPSWLESLSRYKKWVNVVPKIKIIPSSANALPRG